MSSSSSLNELFSDELVLKLSWTNRERLLINLHRHTLLLNSKVNVDTSIKVNLIKDDNQLIHVLFNLPRKKNENENEEKIANSSDGRAFLELYYSLRDRLINNLTKNHFYLLHNETVNLKKELIDENDELVKILMKLPESIEQNEFSDGCEFEGEELIEFNDKFEIPEDVRKKVTKINENVKKLDDNLEEIIKEQKQDQIESNIGTTKLICDQLENNILLGIDRQMSNLRIELNESKIELIDKIENLNKMKSELEFTFKVSKFSNIMNDLAKSTYYSYNHYAQGLPWAIGFNTKIKDEIKYLSLYLYSRVINDSMNWSCGVEASIALMSIKTDKIKKYKFTHNFTSTKGYGWSSFISWDDLMKTENGYYYDDSITIEVKIKAENPIVKN